MKRDMDLIRALLLRLEEHPHGNAPRAIEVDGYDADTIGYHFLIMAEAGLIVATPINVMGQTTPMAIPSRLTWAGHDFLDAAKDDERWGKAKAVVGKLGDVSFDVLKSILTALASEQAKGFM